MEHTTQQRNDDAKITIDNVASILHSGSAMARAGDVLKRIRAALALDATRMKELAENMEAVAEAHNRYLALQRESETHEKSAQALIALLGKEAYFDAMKTDSTFAIGEEIDMFPHVTDLREKAALWEHIAQYLRFVPEAQSGDILSFLQWVGIKTSRQAIESAIRTHPRVFTAKKRGREKFISLK